MMRRQSQKRVAEQGPTLSAAARTWRVTTATRVFVLAMGFGLAANGGVFSSVGPTLAALCVVTALMAAGDRHPTAGPVLPIAEGALVALLLAAVDAPTESILVCLVVPPLVAALRFGVVASLVAVATELATTVATLEVATERGATPSTLDPVLTWLAAGVGVGLLAAWMRSSHRTLERAQAPYEAAHHLLSQLRAVSRSLPVGLDTRSIAASVTQRVGSSISTARSVVLLGLSSNGSLTPLAHSGTTPPSGQLATDASVRRCWTSATTTRPDDTRVCLPLRVGTQTVGVLVVDSEQRIDRATLDHVQPLLDDQSLRLNTALLFDEVRALATTEERNRLAREIHDGIAQEVASLGYLVDDLASGTNDPGTRESAAFLRHQLTRLVSELRFSIFDLRHHVDDEVGLRAALAEYANEIGARAGLSVHLDIDERADSLSPDVGDELMRIAQEAIANVRKHAHARDLWVTLETTPVTARLRIEDNGVGAAAHQPGHYGLITIHERAERIGAIATISERDGGGTVVDVRLVPHFPPTRGVENVDHRVARR